MDETTETGLPRAVAIAWGVAETPQRGPSRGLSHERIVEAAIEIADAQGLGAVTMQAVAQSLGFTTMSLYRYVSSKNELLRLMQDAAAALPQKITLPADWRDALKYWAELLRTAYRAHPWTLKTSRGQVSVLMPNSVRAGDLALGAMQSLDLPEAEKIAVILTVSQHVAASVELELSLADEGDIGISAEGAQMLGEVITPERFPHVAPLMQSGYYVVPAQPGSTTDVDDDPDAEFEFGLALIIAGLEVLEQRHRAQRG